MLEWVEGLGYHLPMQENGPGRPYTKLMNKLVSTVKLSTPPLDKNANFLHVLAVGNF